MPFSEQFIQDTICHPDRLKRVLGERANDWKFECDAFDSYVDVINQEVSFTGGRIDVLATFDRRKNIVIVESKAGRASDEDLQQLLGYLDKWTTLVADLKDGGVDIPGDATKHGILLAEDFGFVDVGEAAQTNVSFVQFRLNAKQPLEPIEHNQLTRLHEAAKPSKRLRRSALYTIDEHIKNDWSEPTKQLCRSVCECFLEDDDVRRRWLVHNPKGQHIAIHYKGEYILHLWPAKSGFAVWSGASVLAKIKAKDVEPTEKDKLCCAIDGLLKDVNAKLADVPDDFWGE